MFIPNKTLKMTVLDLVIVVLLTHVIGHALKKVDLVDFIKGKLRNLKEE